MFLFSRLCATAALQADTVVAGNIDSLINAFLGPEFRAPSLQVIGIPGTALYEAQQEASEVLVKATSSQHKVMTNVAAMNISESKKASNSTRCPPNWCARCWYTRIRDQAGGRYPIRGFLHQKKTHFLHKFSHWHEG